MSKNLLHCFFTSTNFLLASSAFAEEGKNVLTFEQKEQLKDIEKKYTAMLKFSFLILLDQNSYP